MRSIGWRSAITALAAMALAVFAVAVIMASLQIQKAGAQASVKNVTLPAAQNFNCDSDAGIAEIHRYAVTGTTQCGHYFAMPFDYASGDVTLKFGWTIHDNAGVVKLERLLWRADSDTGALTFLGTADVSVTVGFPDEGLIEIVIPEAEVVAGDFYYVDIRRLGDDATDTAGRWALRSGIAAEYVAGN